MGVVAPVDDGEEAGRIARRRRARLRGTLVIVAALIAGTAGTTVAEPWGSARPVDAAVDGTRPVTAALAASAPVADANSPGWSGYSVGGGPFSGVAGTFTVPTLAPAATAAFADEWVGIDGIGTGSLIQAGVAETYDVSASRVAAQAWWQVLPAEPLAQPIADLTVTPGDSIAVRIERVGGTEWSITLTDETTGATFTTRQPYSGPQASAEWIVEAPTAPDGTQEPLAPYSPAVRFTDLAAAGPQTTLTAWTMVQGGIAVSAPGPLSTDGFSVSYVGTPAPRLSPSQVQTIALGQPYTLSATGGTPYAEVQWQVSLNLVTWSPLTTVALDGSGNAVYTFTPSRTAYYRARFTDTGQYGPSIIEVIVAGGPPGTGPGASLPPSPQPSPEAGPPTRGSIAGRVMASSGTPAAGVEVTAVQFPDYGGASATTAADGTFTIQSLAPGTYYLVVQDRSGAFPTGYVNGSSLTPIGPLASVVGVSAGAATEVTVQAPPSVTISGTVRAGGSPLDDVRVYACPALDGTLPTTGVVYCANATTGARSTYTVAVLPGPYTVAFADQSSTYPWTFYSSAGATLDGAAATILSAGTAAIPAVDVTLHRPPDWASIRGTVTDPSGGSRAGVFLDACSTTAPAECYNATTDAANAYRIRVPPGTYTLAVQDPANRDPAGYYSAGGFSPTLAGATTVTVGEADVTGIDVQLPPGHLVEGVVTGPDGMPLPGIVVTPCASAACNGLAWATGPDGSYALNLAPGSYVLHFTEWSGLYASGYYAPGGLANAAGAALVTVGNADVTGIDVALHGISASIGPGVTRTGPFESGRTLVTRRPGYVTVRIAVGKEFAGSVAWIEVASWTPTCGWSGYRAVTSRRVGPDGFAYYFVRPQGWMSFRAGLRDPLVSAVQTAEGLGDVEVFSNAVVAEGR
jgi:hypothetical protein